MGKKSSLKTAEEIVSILNHKNIITFTNCMTRLRVTVREGAQVDQEKLKTLDNVLGLVVSGNEYQIILAPGFVNKVANDFKKIINLEENINEEMKSESIENLAAYASLEKQKFQSGSGIKKFFLRISKVFTPLIPVFIGAGLLSGIAGIILSSNGGADNASDTIKSWNTVLSFALGILTNVFIIAVGWKMGEEFGGNPGVCALVAAMFCGFAGISIAEIFIKVSDTEYNFLGMIINKNNIQHNWFTVGFVNYEVINLPDGSVGKQAVLGAPHAGLIGGMIAVGFTIFVEKQFRKIIPGVLDVIVTPVLVIITILILNFIFIIPAAGYLFTAITWLFNHLYTNPFGAALLVGIFPFAAIFGVHQGFIPIYFALIQETGVNGLFPIMCMAASAQIGCAISMWFMAGKGSVLRKQISSALVPAVLGIGEPLMYGVSVPRVKPFIITCIGGAIGGFIMGAINTWGHVVIGMRSAFGPDQWVAAIMMTTSDGNALKGILIFLSVVFFIYFVGAALGFFAYSKVARFASQKTTNITRAWLETIKNKNEKLENKIFSSLKQFGLMLSYATIIGLPIIWLTWYYKSSNEEKANLKQFKLV